MPANFAKPADLLTHLLSGAALSLDDLQQFVRQHAKESNYHEFKPASWAAQTHAEMIRQWVTSFCNADGGVLLVGISEGVELDGGGRGPRQIQGAGKVGSQALTSWATNVLQKYAGRIVPGPRFSEVVVDDTHSVLCIAVDRTPTLVACKGDEYWVRTGDSTVHVASYLLSDLILGRRRHPAFRVAKSTARVLNPTPLAGGGKSFILNWSVELENRGLVWADPLRVGVVTYSIPTGAPVVEAEDEIMRFLEVHPANLRVPAGHDLALCHCQTSRSGADPLNLEPFERRSLESCASAHLWLPPMEGRTSREAKVQAALYVLARDSPPAWFQLECSFSYRHLSGPGTPPDVQITPCATEARPVVSLELTF